jgi:hypothetical protein
VVICGEDGIPVFDRLRYGRQVKGEALLYAFDLLELDGQDLRHEPLEISSDTSPVLWLRRMTSNSWLGAAFHLGG